MMLDQAIRFGAILDQPEFRTGGVILEVGSGSRGITAFIGQPVIGLDVTFDQLPERGMIAVRASATALPLRNRSCGRVVCSDMLEHLESGQRAKAIHELIRITRETLFLAFPCDEAAQRADARLRGIYRWLKVAPPAWLAEHQHNGLPDSASLEEILNGETVRWRSQVGETARVHFWVSLLIAFKALNYLWACFFYGRPDRAKKISHLARRWSSSHYRRLWVITPQK